MPTTDYLCSNPACDTDHFPGKAVVAASEEPAKSSKPERCPACGSPGKLVNG